TGTLHERDTRELLERCHPLGWFETMPVLCVATNIEARHVLLSDSPPLIALLPRSFTARMTSASDPLPPSDAYPPPTTATTNSRRPTVPGAGPQPNGRLGTPAQNLRELQGLYSFFSSLFPWFNPAGDSAEDGDRGAATGLEDNPPQPPDEETVAQRIRESGVSEEVVVERTQRMMVLQAALLGEEREGEIARARAEGEEGDGGNGGVGERAERRQAWVQEGEDEE
ncbi:hypothetical protein KC327_g13089, partial [Hortaea werneckii]